MTTKQRAITTLVEVMKAVPLLDPPRVWFREIPGAFGMVTGVPFPTLNGVWVHSADVDPAQLSALVQAVPKSSPWSVQVCGDARPIAERTLDDFVLAAQVPLMTLQALPKASPTPLDIRVLPPGDFDARTAIAAGAFEVSVEDMRAATALFSRIDGYRMYLGSMAGHAVTTAVSIQRADSVGIFDVATPAAQRGHGYGSAITCRALNDAFAAGATWAWLQSSDDGYHVYEHLGFQTVDTWSLWMQQ